jgi:uncharacterized membrane protein YkoI
MKIPLIFPAMVVGMTSLLPVAAAAGDRIDQDEARELVQRGEMLPLTELLERHADRTAGHLLDVDLEREHGRLVYEIEVLGSDGRVREFELDARDGRLLKEELED